MKSDKWCQLHDELTEVFNRLGVDDFTNTPDYILAELIRNIIQSIAEYNDENMEWHKWPSLAERLLKGEK